MTFSIVARCERTGQLGVGAATAMIGVGKLVAHARARIGAVASQGLMNPYLALDGLELMDAGRDVHAALETAIAADPGRDHRQVGMVDGTGRAAAWTGAATPEWSGHRVGAGFTVQGNRLVGPETVAATAEAFADHEHRDLAERLLLSLEAGEETGGDAEGTVSGTVYVVDSEQYPLWDVRVDIADDAMPELRRSFERFAEDLVPHIEQLPTREDPLGEATRKAMAQGDS